MKGYGKVGSGLLLLSLCGCAAHPASVGIRKDEAVELRFTCRQPDGKVVASTEDEVARDPGVARSALFREKLNKSPIVVSAGAQVDPDEAKRSLIGYEGEIVARLTETLAGKQFGPLKMVEISAASSATRKGEAQAISYALVRSRPKLLKMTREECQQKFGSKPELGVKYLYDPDLPAGELTSLTDREALFTFTAQPGSQVVTPFGIATIRDAQDHYEIAIDARQGSLVRLANLVGRISAVDALSFTVDFSHPFGGEKLLCDLLLAPPPQAGEK
jgi:FKBP-type peptidyl-prolyl cis-trans isomerase 2